MALTPWKVRVTNRKDGLTSGKTEDGEKDRRRRGLTTLVAVILVTKPTRKKDSCSGAREGRVEKPHNRMDKLDNGSDMNWTMSTEQRSNTTFLCVQCNREFGTLHGLKVHQGRTCMKKRIQCRSHDHQTRSKSSQEETHSGSIRVSVDSPSTQVQIAEELITQEQRVRKPRILWPAANEKAKYVALEEKVLEKMKEAEKEADERDRVPDTKEVLTLFADIIYETASEDFGCHEKKKEAPVVKTGLSRRQKALAQVRRQKQDLQKRRRSAPPEEEADLKALFEDLKKKSRDIQRKERRCTRRKESRRAREKFLKNPFNTAKKLFTEARSGKLKCTKEELDAHVKQTYSDPRRDEPLPHMRGLKRPTSPGVSFDLGPIRKQEVDDFVKKARAKSAPGGDGVSYKVFKYCNKLRDSLYGLLWNLWQDKEMVEDWGRAEGVYLPKEQNAERIDQFRPISIINVACKIYMGILARRTVAYLQGNGYVDESVQKAGVPGIPGCIEHAFTIWDAIQEAKKTNGNLNVVWLDLANAYGSVPHVLLMKAMEFFHIPEEVQAIMRQYYDCFQMRFSTDDFTSEWHRLEVGIAAGCTISVIWFILVMEMLLKATDCPEELAEIRAPKKAFMDDITLLTSEVDTMQNVLTQLDDLITWSRMKFKAKKSRSLTLHKGKQKQEKFTIAGEQMPTIKEEPVKSLGRWYAGTLSDRSRGVEIMNQAVEGLKAIDQTKLPGKYKIWCLQFALYPRLAWPLTMYEVALSRVEMIEKKCNSYIRKWLGLPRTTNTSALYRKKGALQLPFTSIEEIFKAGKVRTVMMLRESRDKEISNNPPDVKSARKWKAEEATNEIISALEHKDIVGSIQTDRAGLGLGNFRPFNKMSHRDRRKSATAQVRTIEAERREVHLIQCAQQGQITSWEQHIVDRKISWNEIWNWNTSRLSFLMRSTYDVLPSPVNLVRWEVQKDNKCRCGAVGTMKHILSNCQLALGRYTWRHNEVLRVFTRMAEEMAEDGKYAQKHKKSLPSKIVFVPEGGKIPVGKQKSSPAELESNGQWKVAADLSGYQGLFPIPTSKKPDLVVWCEEKQEVHLMELTVPHEDNISAAHERKEKRYEALVEECEEAGWKALLFAVEVGCRGFIGESARKWMKVAGLGKKQESTMMKELQETVEKASHWIWLKRDDNSWFET